MGKILYVLFVIKVLKTVLFLSNVFKSYCTMKNRVMHWYFVQSIRELKGYIHKI